MRLYQGILVTVAAISLGTAGCKSHAKVDASQEATSLEVAAQATTSVATDTAGATVESQEATAELVAAAPPRPEPPADRVETPGTPPSPHHVWSNGYWYWDTPSNTYVWAPGVWQDHEATATVAPPALRYEVVGQSPGENYVYAPGYWNWTGTTYVWAPGHWGLRREGYEYAHPYWEVSNGRWVNHGWGWEKHDKEWQTHHVGWELHGGVWVHAKYYHECTVMAREHHAATFDRVVEARRREREHDHLVDAREREREHIIDAKEHEREREHAIDAKEREREHAIDAREHEREHAADVHAHAVAAPKRDLKHR